MTHQRNSIGRKIHPEDTVRYRRRFTWLAISMVVIGAFPPAALVLVPVWVVVGVNERRRYKRQHVPTDIQRVAARGRRTF